MTIAVVQVLRRTGNYAVSRPCREMLYTVLPREAKYKAKNFIDTFVYRLGDQTGAWSYDGLVYLGFGAAAISMVAAPLAVVWLVIGLWLGRRQQVAWSGRAQLSKRLRTKVDGAGKARHQTTAFETRVGRDRNRRA